MSSGMAPNSSFKHDRYELTKCSYRPVGISSVSVSRLADTGTDLEIKLMPTRWRDHYVGKHREHSEHVNIRTEQKPKDYALGYRYLRVGQNTVSVLSSASPQRYTYG